MHVLEVMYRVEHVPEHTGSAQGMERERLMAQWGDDALSGLVPADGGRLSGANQPKHNGACITVHGRV